MSKESIKRVEEYIARRKKSRGIDVNHVHSFDVGPDCGVELLLSDIEAILSAAAPQVVADEPTDSQMKEWYEEASSVYQSLRKDRYAFGRACYRAGLQAAPVQAQEPEDDFYTYACEELERGQEERAKRGVEIGCQGSLCDGIAWLFDRLKKLESAAPVQAEEQWIDKLTYDAQVDEWAIEKSNLEREIEAIKSRAPVQPVAVPDGFELAFNAKRLRRTAALLGLAKSIPPLDDELMGCLGAVLGMICREVEKLIAAPAAQGDAIRKVEVDDQGPLGVVTKTTYALANAKDAEAAAFYRHLRDEVIGDDPEAIGMKCAKKSGLDAACRAAIAAKAAS